MPVYYEWTSKRRENVNKHLPGFEVSMHPLKVNSSHFFLSVNRGFIESLNKWSSGFEELDPLLRFEKLNEENENLEPEKVMESTKKYTKAWSTRRASVLNTYTTGEKLTILSSFLPGGEKTLIRQVSNLNEKVKYRLEQLDDFEEGSVRKTMGLSQQEYISKINMLSDEIKKAWDCEQRVKAFKIGIQCSKLLSDVSVMQFYPSKFVLITEILDTFGDLVFDRLKRKSFGPNQIISLQDIDPREVPESARETCQNWMFKMASIRELLPRLYMEMALLKCYVFIDKKEVKNTILRLTKMIRGIGNPLVAVYLRMHLCRVASKLLNKGCEEYFYENLKEFISDYQQIFHPTMKKKYETQLLTVDKYLNIYTPAVEWLLHGTLNSDKSKPALLDELLEQCQKIENNELLLCCIITGFDSSSLIEKSSQLLEMIQNGSEEMIMMNEALAALGEHLCNADCYQRPPAEALLQTWWKLATCFSCTNHFLQVLEPWLQFACMHLSTQHVNIILRGTIRYMIKCGKPADEFAGNFQLVIKRMLNSVPDVEELLLMDAFMPLVELVQTSNARVLMAKTVLSIFFARHSSDQIDDPIVISSLMRLCCILHDSINAVTVEDECKICADLINKLVQSVTYHDDYEQQLNFYVECRSAFIKLDAVLIALVHAVNALAARTRGPQSKWLQRACAAYCYVTAPSLHCALTKAQLYLLSGQVALLHNCIGQAEANFKALVGLIPDIPEFIYEDAQKKPTNIRVEGLLSNFLSTLLILPDNVDSNCKAYVLSGFIKLMERIHWKKTDHLYYSTLLKVLDLLCELTQENYAYHLDSVISNDKLYGSEPEFIETLDKYATNICQELSVVMKLLGEQKETKKQHSLALELFWRVVRRADLKEGPMLSLAVNLWTLAKTIQDTNDKLSKSMLASIHKIEDPTRQQLLQKLEQA